MRETFASELVCPSCGGALCLQESETDGGRDRCREGVLECACGWRFPVVDGIPRLVFDAGILTAASHTSDNARQVIEEFRHKYHRTQESFGRQWLRYDVQSIDEDRQTWEAKTGLACASLRGLRVLDAGCGGGRYSFVAGQAGAHVVAVDVSRAVEKTAELCSELPQVDVVQADLTRLPLRKASFDVIFSIGVLHHTPKTREAFEALLPYLKPGGRIAIWLYARWSPFRERMNGFWRGITTRLPHPVIHAVSVLGSPLGGLRGRVYASRHRVLARLLWQTEKLLPGFSNHPSRAQRICDTFDWLTPQYQWHHTDNEVRVWFEEAGLTNIRNVTESATQYYPGQGEGVCFLGERPKS